MSPIPGQGATFNYVEDSIDERLRITEEFEEKVREGMYDPYGYRATESSMLHIILLNQMAIMRAFRGPKGPCTHGPGWVCSKCVKPIPAYIPGEGPKP